MTEPLDVEEELRTDRMLYGKCFWFVLGGRKVRIPPTEILIGDDGAIIAPHITAEIVSDNGS